MKITINQHTKSAGHYVWHLSNGHSIVISHCPELSEWHLFGNDPADNSYEPCHPFYDTFGEAKSQLFEAIQNIEKSQVSMASPDWTN